MAASSTPVVIVRQARNMLHGVPARHIKTFDDGTALVRFAAGNFRIVALELVQPATKAEAEEYYGESVAQVAGLPPIAPVFLLLSLYLDRWPSFIRGAVEGQ